MLIVTMCGAFLGLALSSTSSSKWLSRG